MKKELLILGIICLLVFTGCAKSQADIVYDKYSENGDFLVCYKAAMNNKEKAIEEIPEEFKQKITNPVFKEIIVNNCIYQNAIKNMNKETCNDLFVDKSLDLNTDMIAEDIIIGLLIGIPTSTEQYIQKCNNLIENGGLNQRVKRANSAYWQTTEIGILAYSFSSNEDTVKIRLNLRDNVIIKTIKIGDSIINEEESTLSPGETKTYTIDTPICNNEEANYEIPIEITYINSETGVQTVFDGLGNKLIGNCAN